MKKLLELIKKLSLEKDKVKKDSLSFEIELLKKQLNDEKLKNDIQKSYGAFNSF